jgi:hypothetical protein
MSAAPMSASAGPMSSGAAPAALPSATPRLTAIALQQADLPAGWTGTPYMVDPGDAANDTAMAKCTGGRDTDADESGESHSPNYALAGATVSSQASSFRTADDLTADVATLHSAKISGCFDALLRAEVAASLPAGTTVNAVAITITPTAAGAAPSNVVATGSGTVTVTSSGLKLGVFLNVAFITGPSIEAELDFENLGQPVPAAVQTALIAKVAARAAAA